MPSKNVAQRDEVIEARREFDRELDRIGNYLEGGNWVATSREVTFFSDDRITNFSATTGELQFKQLKNGNLKAKTIVYHAEDNFKITANYLIAINPSQNTFLGTRYQNAEGLDGGIITGSIDRRTNTLAWNDFAPSSMGTSAGENYLRSMNFVNIS